MEIVNETKKNVVYVQFVQRGLTAENKPTTKTVAKMLTVTMREGDTPEMLRTKVIEALK